MDDCNCSCCDPLMINFTVRACTDAEKLAIDLSCPHLDPVAFDVSDCDWERRQALLELAGLGRP